MSTPKELFNQPTTTSPDNADRVAMGQPATAGAKNITWANFLLAIKSYLTAFFSLFETASSGTYNVPGITKTGSHEVTLDGTGIVNFYTSSDAKSKIVQFTVPTKVLTLTNNAVNYVYADYNSGTPQYAVTTNPSTFTTDGRKRGVFRIIDENDTLYYLSYNEWGVAQSDKTWAKDVALRGIERQSGLALTTAATRKSTVASGLVWFSDYTIAIPQNVAGTTGSLYEYYKSAGNWVKSANLSEYDSTYYNGATDRATMDNNKYKSIYFYVNCGSQNEVYFISGNQFTSLAEAVSEEAPTPPSIMLSHSFALLQKIVIQKSATNGTIYAVSKTGGGSVGITQHNDLGGRDVAGNHAKLIPSANGTTAIQITKADGTTVLLNVDSTNSIIKVISELVASSADVEASVADAVGKLLIKGLQNNSNPIDLEITGTPTSLGKNWTFTVKDPVNSDVKYYELYHDNDSGEYRIQMFKKLWVGTGDYGASGYGSVIDDPGLTVLESQTGIRIGKPISTSNYSEFESTGFQRLNGSARGYKDIDFSLIVRTSGTGIPAISTILGNITGPQWAVNDALIAEGQEFIHEWEEGTQVSWHVHMVTAVSDGTNRYVNWEIEYNWANPNGAWAVANLTQTSGDYLIPANTTIRTMFIIPIGTWTPTGGKIGGHVKARLKRVASTGTAPSVNPFCDMLQMHIRIDTPSGSRNLTTK